MSLDFLRAVTKSNGEALTVLHEDICGKYVTFASVNTAKCRDPSEIFSHY